MTASLPPDVQPARAPAGTGTPSSPSKAQPKAAENAAAASFKALMARLDYLTATDIELVRRAYRFADEAHLGQMRKSGEPYITHPIAVAAMCAEWKLDAQALMAALLHDAMEDCGVSKVDLMERFGSTVAELVDGLTKLDKLEFNTREETQAESFRKMLLAMAKDVRVILVKLADRTHNMRTMSDMPRSKWGRISNETLDIYAPIAHRLGLNLTYRELQDLGFRYSQPWRYETIKKAVTKARSRRRDLIQKVQAQLDAEFGKAKIEVRISGREKPLFSIYRKMKSKSLTFAQVNDIYGFRIILPSVIDCYTALGVLHQLYKPVPGRFKDYIAIPKSNGYQSLHTTLVGPSNVSIEFQMRTEEMHLIAESGIAAHWLYKNHESGHSTAAAQGTMWVKSLLDIQSETRDAAEFWDHVKVDLFPDAVYVFTPKGQIMALPRGATVVDFAYAIHSNIGDRTVAAQVNGEQVPLRTEVRNGDVVEVVTTKISAPNPAWLGFVRTGRARARIRHHLKTLAQAESEELGQRLLLQAVRAEGLEVVPDNSPPNQPIWDRLLRFTGNRTLAELHTDLGLGKRVANIVAKRLVHILSERGVKPDALLMTRERFTAHENISQGAVSVDGSENSLVQFAHCCRPVPGDAIVGYLGHGEGLAVHRAECPVAKRLRQRDSESFMQVAWTDEPVRAFEATVVVTVNNGKGVLARIANALAAAEVDIVHLDMGEQAALETMDLHILVGVRDIHHLDAALRALARLPMVLKAKRNLDR